MAQHKSKLYLIGLLLALSSIKPTQPYSMGAPDQACGAMFPGHQFDAQDNAKVPVTFTISPDGPVAPESATKPSGE